VGQELSDTGEPKVGEGVRGVRGGPILI
jgi:hypothetical protein